MFDLNRFAYNKNSRLLTASLRDLGMRTLPQEVEIRSHLTGHIVKFVYDNEAAERHEFWDGEMAEYKPVGECRVAKLAIIAN
jgi:hypothetical protein